MKSNVMHISINGLIQYEGGENEHYEECTIFARRVAMEVVKNRRGGVRGTKSFIRESALQERTT